jgi:hypothetical protein
MKRLVLFPYTFVLMNWAAVAGLYHAIRGTPDIWCRPVNRDDSATSQPSVAGGYQVVTEFRSKLVA